MACPTCSATMQRASNVSAAALFWCPRCGTLSGPDGPFTVPALVDRCREFEKDLADDGLRDKHETLWQKLGILEAIHRPEDRPQHPENRSPK